MNESEAMEKEGKGLASQLLLDRNRDRLLVGYTVCTVVMRGLHASMGIYGGRGKRGLGDRVRSLVTGYDQVRPGSRDICVE